MMNRSSWSSVARLGAIALSLVVACLVAPAAGAAEGKKLVVFVAGKPSHGPLQHEHNAGVQLLAKSLTEGMGDKIETKFYLNGWPSEPGAFDGAAAVVMFSDGGNGHMVLPHLDEVDALAKKGVGIGCIHYAVEPGDGTKQPDGRKQFLSWIGGYFKTYWSVNPHWKAEVTSLPNHPVANGVRPFSTLDEWYYHMEFRQNMEGVTPIVAAVPPDTTRQGKDNPHGGNEEVRKGIGKSLPEYTVWVSENKETGNRGFGCTGAHFHWNWAQDDFRKCVLNAITWIAKVEVPADGVKSTRPTAADIMANADPKQPNPKQPAPTMEEVQQKIDEMNKPFTPSGK